MIIANEYSCIIWINKDKKFYIIFEQAYKLDVISVSINLNGYNFIDFQIQWEIFCWTWRNDRYY